MSKLPTIKTILSGFFSTGTLNNNFTVLRDAFGNTLSRDGSTPNTMEADIDLNSHDLLNVGKITADDITVAGEPLAFQEGIAEVNAIAVEVEQAKLDAQAAAQAAQDAENSLLEWAGPWTTAVTYAPSDLVSFDGSTYVCVIAHTSGVFATDFGAGKWQLFASKGSPGAGTGDMFAANNLSELANKDTALTNLGGTVVGKAVFKATDAAAGRTALGLGSLATKSEVTVSEIAAATLVTATDTIASNNNDTTIPTSAAVKAYADGAVSAITTMNLLGTLTTTSGTTQTLSGLTLTPYKSLLVVMDGVSLNANAAITLGGVAITGVITASDGCYGHASVDLASGIVSAVIMNGNTTDRSAGKAASPMAGRTSYSTATTSISFASGTFDGGSIRVYGVK